MFVLASHAKQLVILWTPRCMCTKLKMYAWSQLDGKRLPSYPLQSIHGCIPLPETDHDVETELAKYPSYKIIAAIRDPLRRFVSACNHRHVVSKCLKAWDDDPCILVENVITYLKGLKSSAEADPHFAPQTTHISSDSTLSAVDHVIRIEDRDAIPQANAFLTKHHCPPLPEEEVHPVQTTYVVDETHITSTQRAFLVRFYERDYALLPYDPEPEH